MADIRKVNVNETEYGIMGAQSVTVTVPSSGWSTTSGDPTCRVAVTGVLADDNLVIGPAQTITADQLSAWGSAQMLATSQEAGYVTFTALSGTAPTVDLSATIFRV